MTEQSNMITDKHGRPQDANYPLRFGDMVKGDLEQNPGELLGDKEVTRRADAQRAMAQADEPADYPGDSGKQAAAKAEAVKDEAAEQNDAVLPEADEQVPDEDLTSLTREELDALAEREGVENPGALANKDAVADAIRDARASG